MNTLYELLKENAQIYKLFLDLEYKKYDTVIKNDIKSLDDIVSKEQVYYLKMRGLEQKREKLMETLGFGDNTLKEIIEMSDGDENTNLIEMYEELNKLIKDVKNINGLCKTLIDVRLHRLDKAMNQIGEKENTYSNGEIRNNIAKSVVFSRKI